MSEGQQPPRTVGFKRYFFCVFSAHFCRVKESRRLQPSTKHSGSSCALLPSLSPPNIRTNSALAQSTLVLWLINILTVLLFYSAFSLLLLNCFNEICCKLNCANVLFTPLWNSKGQINGSYRILQPFKSNRAMKFKPVSYQMHRPRGELLLTGVVG